MIIVVNDGWYSTNLSISIYISIYASLYLYIYIYLIFTAMVQIYIYLVIPSVLAYLFTTSVFIYISRRIWSFLQCGDMLSDGYSLNYHSYNTHIVNRNLIVQRNVCIYDL